MPAVAGPPAPWPGLRRQRRAAIPTPDPEAAKNETDRASKIAAAEGTSGGTALETMVRDGKPVRDVPLNMHQFLGTLGAVDETPGWKPEPLTVRGKLPDPACVAPVRSTCRVHPETVAKFGRGAQRVLEEGRHKSLDAYEKSSEWYRDYFQRGHRQTARTDDAAEPALATDLRRAEVERLRGDARCLSGRVRLRHPAGAQGLKPGEKRPVVVCQHGLEGRPTDVADPKKKTPYYNSLRRQLADRGYIVYAPQNPYIGRRRFRQLQRKANPLEAVALLFIVRQHERTLDWLATLPYVDPKRIAFYGLSYGGKTAMRVPAILTRYCLSICSADFNEWVWKNVSLDSTVQLHVHGEYEMHEFDLGNTFNYAEMAAPDRPAAVHGRARPRRRRRLDEWSPTSTPRSAGSMPTS